MKTQLKDGIWIEGFDLSDLSEYFLAGVNYTQSNDKEVLFVGKTSEISEELAKTCIDWNEFDDNIIKYYDYIKDYWPHLTAKESIQSACSQEYCIIYKTK